MQGLSARQQRFVDEYMIDLNASAAYQRAGYVAQGNAAEANASRLIRNAKVAIAINEAKLAQSQRTHITADRVLLEAARLAFVDVRKLYDTDGKLLPVTAWDDETAAAVAGLEVSEQYDYVDGQKVLSGQLKKVRLWSKPDNLTLLAKHLRLLQEDTSKDTIINIQVNIKTSITEALARAYDSPPQQSTTALPNGSSPAHGHYPAGR